MSCRNRRSFLAGRSIALYLSMITALIGAWLLGVLWFATRALYKNNSSVAYFGDPVKNRLYKRLSAICGGLWITTALSGVLVFVSYPIEVAYTFGSAALLVNIVSVVVRGTGRYSSS